MGLTLLVLRVAIRCGEMVSRGREEWQSGVQWRGRGHVTGWRWQCHTVPLQCFLNCYVGLGVAVGWGSKRGLTNSIHPPWWWREGKGLPRGTQTAHLYSPQPSSQNSYRPHCICLSFCLYSVFHLNSLELFSKEIYHVSLELVFVSYNWQSIISCCLRITSNLWSPMAG